MSLPVDVPFPVLILDNSYTFGGAINSLCHLLRFLDDKRFAPVLVTGQPTEYLASNFRCTWYHHTPRLPWVNNRIYRAVAAFPAFRLRLPRKALSLIRFVYWFVFVTLPQGLKYARLGRKHRVVLVHLNNILGSQIAGIIAAKLLRVPCVAHMRDFEEIDPLTRYLARLVDHHVAISSAVRDNLRQLGVPEDRMTVVHDAVDLAEFDADIGCSQVIEEFNLPPGQPRYGIFGRVVEWKGIREFLHAARAIADRIPEAKGFVVGGHSDGDEAFLNEMRLLAAELGLTEKVLFTGYRRDVPALMTAMDVVVHASNRPEPFGMVIIEAMAVGKPVVATGGGGPLDIVVDGETGCLVDMGDPSALAQATIRLLEDPDAARRMGLRGRARAREAFSADRCALQMESIFQALCGTPQDCRI